MLHGASTKPSVMPHTACAVAPLHQGLAGELLRLNRQFPRMVPALQVEQAEAVLGATEHAAKLRAGQELCATLLQQQIQFGVAASQSVAVLLSQLQAARN